MGATRDLFVRMEKDGTGAVEIPGPGGKMIEGFRNYDDLMLKLSGLMRGLRADASYGTETPGTPGSADGDLRRRVIEECAQRLDVLAFSLEMERHAGLPDPVAAVNQAAERIRALATE